ncbi:alpha/beta fold hydrolase [Nocardia sp. NPDC050713]|uniref:lipase family alpha/beta hydrolase n=1 Tax=Nocardia sp. NPDC050713 TaxID=3154511 RepID=UPI003403EF6D
MRISRRWIAVLAAAVAMVAGWPSGLAAAEELPTYSYLSGLAAQLTGPNQAPPGANDWSCRPSDAHSNPVVLLHGLSNDTITWNTLSPVLAAAGYCVFSTTYGTGPLGPIGAVAPVADSARQIADFVDRVLAATGARQIDLVGHSMGGAIPFYYLNHLGGVPTIDDYIALAAPLHGSTLSGTDALFSSVLDAFGLREEVAERCGPCQMSPGSPFLDVLNPDPAIAPDIDFTTIVTRYDQIATPYTTGLLDGPNVRNIVLQDLCATDYTEHYELTADPVAVREVLNALDPAAARPADCAVVLPYVGPVGR